MEQIPSLKREDFDFVMHRGKDLILFFYRENDPASILGIQTMNEINSLLGRSFDLYLINFDEQPEIADAFSVKKIPEYITMKQTKIYKRNTELLNASEVLEMLK